MWFPDVVVVVRFSYAFERSYIPAQKKNGGRRVHCCNSRKANDNRTADARIFAASASSRSIREHGKPPSRHHRKEGNKGKAKPCLGMEHSLYQPKIDQSPPEQDIAGPFPRESGHADHHGSEQKDIRGDGDQLNGNIRGAVRNRVDPENVRFPQ
jgi:hypothetical protein